MRLLKLLNEEISLNNIKKECKYYINLVKKNNTKNKFLYRGVYKSYDFEKRKVRQDRKPMNMDKVLHDHFNKLFKKRFGKNLRSETLFVTSDYEYAKFYGIMNIVIPVGKFNYYYNPSVGDLYNDLSFNIKMYKNNTEKYKEEMERLVDGYKKNQNFKYMMDNHYGEIMINCKEYYITDIDYDEILKEQLFKE